MTTHDQQTKGVLEQVSQLGVAVWHVLLLLAQRVDDVTEAGQRLEESSTAAKHITRQQTRLMFLASSNIFLSSLTPLFSARSEPARSIKFSLPRAIGT
jgi:hypothetical protein